MLVDEDRLAIRAGGRLVRFGDQVDALPLSNIPWNG